MKYLLYMVMGASLLLPTYAAVNTAQTPTPTEVVAAEPVKRKTFWQRLKEKAHTSWQALKEKLRSMADDLIRFLIIALIVVLIVSVLAWLLPWPLDVLIVVVALIVLLVFLLRYL